MRAQERGEEWREPVRGKCCEESAEEVGEDKKGQEGRACVFGESVKENLSEERIGKERGGCVFWRVCVKNRKKVCAGVQVRKK